MGFRRAQRAGGPGAGRRESARFRPDGPSAPRDRPLPLSAGQLFEWVFDKLVDGDLSHQPTIVRLRGPLNTAALRMAYARLVRRHECLRTRFPVIDGEPVQVIEDIGKAAGGPLPLIDLRHLPEALRAREIARIREETLSTPVPFDKRPPVRVALIRAAPEEHLFLVGIPHITADLWSATLLNDELMAHYRAGAEGTPSRAPTPVAQYADFAQWQRAWWNRDRTEREAGRWRARLDGLSAVELPLDRPRPAGRRRDCFLIGDTFDAELSDRLRALARTADVTLYVVLLAAFHWLVGRMSGAGRLVTTSLVAARHGSAVQGMTGPFSDYLALVGDLSGDPDFLESLRRVRDECLTAHDHQRLPFSQVLEVMDPGRELHPHPLEQLGFNLHNIPPAVMDFSGDVVVSAVNPEGDDGESGDGEYVPWTADLTFDVYDYGTGHMPFDVILDRRLADPATAREWAGHYRSVLRAVVADPGVRLSALGTLLSLPRPPSATSFGGREIDVRRVERELAGRDGITAALVAVAPRRLATGLRVRELVAYCAVEGTPRPNAAHDIRGRLRERLPDGWVPTVFVERPPEEIRKALAARAAGGERAEPLPPPEDCVPLPEEGRPPSDPSERRLAALWAEILGAPPKSVTEPFFRVGVTDKDALRFLARVAEDFGVTVPFADFLSAPNLRMVKDNLAEKRRV
ncbi:condensation domain-containing protein [Streptomyces mobaraensis]|uniref:condensation domain-containing protein n=1 Tax=Streptomyces mobaraensis TaxID=35621 RepID=UPI000997D6B1